MKPGKRKILLVSGGAIVTLIVLGLTSVWVVLVVPKRSTYRRLSHELEDDVADFHSQRWTRPVLRGEPIEGNAFDVQLEAVLPTFPEGAMDEVGGQLRSREPFSASVLSLVREHRAGLVRYREATQRAWSWGDFPVEEGFAAEEIEYLPHLRTTRLLLVAARDRTPAECVPMALDALRLGQDRSAGRTLVGLMIHAASSEEAFVVVYDCLRRAGDTTLAQASRELTILAEHPGPMGYAMEIEALSAGATFREMLEPIERLPLDSQTFEVWTQSSDTLDAWERLTEDPAQRRHIGESYPGDFADLAAWQSSLRSGGNPLLSIATPDFTRYLRRDAAVRTRVRALLAMSRLLQGEPRSILEEPGLHDALTGRPLETREVEGGLELRSAGEDGSYGPGAEGEVDDVIALVAREEVLISPEPSPPTPPE